MHFMLLILAFLLWAMLWGALAANPDHKAIAIYLAVMAGGTGFMIVVSVGGLVRNLLLFPLSRRAVEPGELRA